jgi:hypothetical protein
MNTDGYYSQHFINEIYRNWVRQLPQLIATLNKGNRQNDIWTHFVLASSRLIARHTDVLATQCCMQAIKWDTIPNEIKDGHAL